MWSTLGLSGNSGSTALGLSGMISANIYIELFIVVKLMGGVLTMGLPHATAGARAGGNGAVDEVDTRLPDRSTVLNG